jgi:hypothetical protein
LFTNRPSGLDLTAYGTEADIPRHHPQELEGLIRQVPGQTNHRFAGAVAAVLRIKKDGIMPCSCFRLLASNHHVKMRA